MYLTQEGAEKVRVELEQLKGPARLEITEVAARGHFEPAFGTGRPHLEVIALGGGKGHVARSEQDHAIGEPESLQNGFRIGSQRFVLLVGPIGIEAVTALKTIKEAIEDPTRLLIDL
jgi:hypothetical protein